MSAKNMQWGMDNLHHKMVLGKLYSYMQKNETGSMKAYTIYKSTQNG